MATRFRFYDSVDEDRTYTSDAWAQWARGLITEGYVPELGDSLEVSASDPADMTVDVGTGVVWVDGRYFEVYSAAEELVIPAADGSNPRIDRVVVRNDFENRETVLAIKSGDPASSPEPPSLTRTSTIYEITLAQIAVGAGTSSISNSDITDERDDSELCGRAEPRSVSAPIIRSLDVPQGYQLKADGSGGADWEAPSDVDTHGNEAHSPNFSEVGHTHDTSGIDDEAITPVKMRAEYVPGNEVTLASWSGEKEYTSGSQADIAFFVAPAGGRFRFQITSTGGGTRRIRLIMDGQRYTVSEESGSSNHTFDMDQAVPAGSVLVLTNQSAGNQAFSEITVSGNRVQNTESGYLASA